MESTEKTWLHQPFQKLQGVAGLKKSNFKRCLGEGHGLWLLMERGESQTDFVFEVAALVEQASG